MIKQGKYTPKPKPKESANSRSNSNLVGGLFGVLFSLLMLASGVGAPLGYASLGYSLDMVGAGISQEITGKETMPLLQRGTTAFGRDVLGLSPESAKTFGSFAHTGIGLVLGGGLSKAPRAVLNPQVTQKVALDANALIHAIEGSKGLVIDNLINGRIPTVSRTAVKEFLVKGDVNLLRSYLVERGGYIGKSGTQAEIQGLINQASNFGYRLNLKDAAVGASAIRENAQLIITNDKTFRNFLNHDGYSSIGF